MRIHRRIHRLISPFVFFTAIGLAALAVAQGSSATAQPSHSPQGAGFGRRGDRGEWGGRGGMMGRGVMGTVMEISSDHFTVKTETGELYSVHYSVNTRIMKVGGGRHRTEAGEEPPMLPPEPIKASDIKVGDAIAATGEMDANGKSLGAVAIFQIDPERAKQMREMQANFGKTWLAGRVSAVNDVKVTIEGGPDNSTHTFAADENTTFRKRREPITLADIRAGDVVRVEGAVKDGEFLASTVFVIGAPSDRGAGSLPSPR